MMIYTKDARLLSLYAKLKRAELKGGNFDGEDYVVIQKISDSNKALICSILESDWLLRINELDETLYNINEGIKILRSNPKDKDYEQKSYELDQILNLHIDLKTKQENKRKKIYEQISIL